MYLLHLALVSWAAYAEVTVVNSDTEAQKPVQLTAGTFDNEVRRVPSSIGVLVEYYAHWYVTLSIALEAPLWCYQ